jgi:hypothetical protein
MKSKIGIIFLIVFSLDLFLSLIASLFSSLESISNVISVLTLIFVLFMLIYSIYGKIKPKKIFLSLTSYYLAMSLIGTVLAAILTSRYGSKISTQDISLAFLFKEFPWFNTVHWILMIAWLVLTTWEIIEYKKYESR